MEKIEDQNSKSLSSNESTSDSFWGAFDKDTQSASNQELSLIDSEIRWLSGVSPLSRSTYPCTNPCNGGIQTRVPADLCNVDYLLFLYITKK